MSDFVFQESDGGHINRKTFYRSWRGQWSTHKLKDGTKKRYPPKGIVFELAVLGEDKGGIDHYRPQYNTRHTFISLAVEGMIELNESTMSEVVTLADYVGNSADVILKHYLGRSEKRKMVIISEFREKLELSESNEKNFQDQATQSEQIVKLKQQNSLLQAALQSLVQFIHTVLIQFVPEALKAQLSAFVVSQTKDHLPNSIFDQPEPVGSLDEEMARCAAWLSFEDNTDG